MLIGLLGWLAWWLTLEPVLHGGVPNWSADSAARTYRELVAGLLHGGLTGVLVQSLRSLTGRKPAAVGARPAAPDRRRVVIVGDGFAGVAAARLSVHPKSPDVTLISESNFLLFTPMLAEVASGAVEPAHISVPVRAAAPGRRGHGGEAAGAQYRLLEHVDQRHGAPPGADLGFEPAQVARLDYSVRAGQFDRTFLPLSAI